MTKTPSPPRNRSYRRAKSPETPMVIEEVEKNRSYQMRLRGRFWYDLFFVRSAQSTGTSEHLGRRDDLFRGWRGSLKERPKCRPDEAGRAPR